MASVWDRDPQPDAAALARSHVPRQLARTDSSGQLGQGGQHQFPDVVFDRRPVKDLLTHLGGDPEGTMEYFYARLFADNPDLRALFPYSMTQTRAAVFGMLASLIRGLDEQQVTAAALGRIARDHRKFGVREKHYEPFFRALLATAEHVAGSAWTARTAGAWRSALDYFAAVMADAAAADARSRPAWWTGEIVQHDRRTDTVAVLTIRPDRPLRYEPGQYVAVQAPRWPRIWRNYSIANAPRENGLLDIHVRAVPGGMVSTALVSHCVTGDVVLLGAATGGMRMPADPASDIVCVAGGTGLAPVKAIVEAVVGAARQGRRPSITLYAGARRSRDLYDTGDLAALRLAYPSLTVIPVAERELDFDGRVGRLPDVVKSHPSFRDCDVYVAGPAGLITATVRALARRVPAERMHHDSIEALQFARLPTWQENLTGGVGESRGR